MNLFRQLRWKLTFSYTIVTISTLLVIVLILGGILLSGIFVPENALNPEQMIEGWMNGTMGNNYRLWSQILSQSPVDRELINLLLADAYTSFSISELFRIGALQFSVRTLASIRVLILGPDGVLLGVFSPNNPQYQSAVGQVLDPKQVPGLEVPLKAALAGDIDPKHLYTVLEPNKRYVFAGPIFHPADGGGKRLVGVEVVLFDSVPTQKDIPVHVLRIAGIILIVFLVGAGSIGALFGAFFSHGLDKRFKQISATTDQWSAGDFTKQIDASTGDEVAQFARRLNSMAGQLQSLLRKRQETAVYEERNRLARDLHDSAKQQALAASFELGTALALFERDPADAKKHLVQADTLVDAVRKELTDLVDELRPLSPDGQDFAVILREYIFEWSQRNGIELNMDIADNATLALETRESLFRITQEALANIARHSSATSANVSLEYSANAATLVIKDNGCGFDTRASHNGVGLSSMRERAETSGGNFTVESTPGRGTQITVTIPLAR